MATVLAVVNPKVLFMCAAAGLVIGAAGLGAAASWTGVGGSERARDVTTIL